MLLQQVDQQTSSTVDAAASSDASTSPDHRAGPPAIPHALMLALRGLDDTGLRREFDKHADKAEGERRMSKAGLASFMRNKGLAHGDADVGRAMERVHVGRAMERVDTNKDGDIDYAEFCALGRPTPTSKRCCRQSIWKVSYATTSPRAPRSRTLEKWAAPISLSS